MKVELRNVFTLESMICNDMLTLNNGVLSINKHKAKILSKYIPKPSQLNEVLSKEEQQNR